MLNHPFFLHPECLEQMTRIAGEKLASGALSPMFKVPSETTASEILALHPVASRLTEKSVPNDPKALAELLFEPAAFDYLLAKSANPYWFWYLIARLKGRVMPVSLSAAARAHARAADSLYDNRYGFAFVKPGALEHQLKQLPPGFLFEMWHKGRIICENTGSGEFRTSLNPILLED